MQKKEFIGAGNADISKPWLNHLYIEYDNYESTLLHEIAHCFTSEFGVTIFKTAAGFNPALMEGIAMAAENKYDEMDLHSSAALAFRNNFVLPIDKLFTGLNFFSQLSSISYIYSGSF